MKNQKSQLRYFIICTLLTLTIIFSTQRKQNKIQFNKTRETGTKQKRIFLSSSTVVVVLFSYWVIFP